MVPFWHLEAVIMCKGKQLPKNINFLGFNVDGLKPKLEEPHVLGFFDNYGISILTETWKADTSKINIEGFWDFSQVRLKHKHAIRHFGGITIFAKFNIRPELNLLKTQKVSFGLV